jgi:phytoene synthase
LPARCRPAIRAAGRLYDGIGEAVARAGHDSVTARAVVPAGHKVALLAGSFGGRRGVLLTPSAASDFLVGAVWPAPSSLPAMAPWQRVDDKIGWVVELFARLNELDRVNGISEPSPVDRAAEA